MTVIALVIAMTYLYIDVVPLPKFEIGQVVIRERARRVVLERDWLPNAPYLETYRQQHPFSPEPKGLKGFWRYKLSGLEHRGWLHEAVIKATGDRSFDARCLSDEP